MDALDTGAGEHDSGSVNDASHEDAAAVDAAMEGATMDASMEAATEAGGGDGGGDSSSGDGATSDASAGDAGAEGGCTPPVGGTYSCGANDCDGTSDYCLVGMASRTCEPLPPQCRCAETLDCACLLAHVTSPCGIGSVHCFPMHDGGLYWLEAIDCP
jgi:hypothetical protein